MAVVGFDVGSETSYICMAKGVGFDVLENEFSQRYSFTTVSFGKKKRMFGASADGQLLVNIKGTVSGVKNLIGLKYNDPIAQNEMSRSFLDFVHLPNSEIGVKVKYLNEEKVFSVKQIFSMYLSHLKIIAQRNTEKKISDCVISVPMFFTEYQRRCVFEAAQIAGLACNSLINDGTAVCLAFTMYRASGLSEFKKLAYIDVGVDKVTVTVAQVKNGHLRILSSVCSSNCGAREVDRMCYDIILSKFLSKNPTCATLTEKARLKLIKQCSMVKKKISISPTVPQQVSVDNFHESNSIDLYESVSLEEICQMAESNFKPEFKSLLSRVLQSANTVIEELELIETSGSSSRFPLYHAMISEFFGKPASSMLNADEVVSLGCGLMAAKMSPLVRVKNVEIQDIFHDSVSVKWEKTEKETIGESVVFGPGQIIPSTRALLISRKEDFHFEVYYNSECPVRVEHYKVSGVTADEQGNPQKVTINFGVNSSGIFCVLDAAMAVKKVQPIEETTEVSMPSDDSTPSEKSEESSESAGVPKPEEPVKQTKVVTTSVPLVITCIKGFNCENRKAEIDQCIKIESDILARIDFVEKTGAALNELETKVYDCRNQLDAELNSYLTPSQSNELKKHVSDLMDWIDDVKFSDAYTIEVCDSRRKLLEDAVAPAINRYNFHSQLPGIISQDQLLVSCGKLVEAYRAGVPEYSHVDTKLAEQFETTYSNTVKMFDELSLFVNIPKEELPNIRPLDLNMIRKNFAYLSDALRAISAIPDVGVVNGNSQEANVTTNGEQTP